jgi:hypothetical protein
MKGNEGYWGGGISIITQNFPKSPSILFHPLQSSISQTSPPAPHFLSFFFLRRYPFLHRIDRQSHQPRLAKRVVAPSRLAPPSAWAGHPATRASLCGLACSRAGCQGLQHSVVAPFSNQAAPPPSSAVRKSSSFSSNLRLAELVLVLLFFSES